MSKNFGDYGALVPRNMNEMLMQVLIAGDISGSMYRFIDSVNACINRFKSDVCKDPKAARSVETAVIAFNDNVKVVQDWRPITEMEPVELKAGGGTDMKAALEKSLEMIIDRNHLCSDNGIELKQSYMILVTDGKCEDITEIANKIKQRSADKKMKLWVLAVEGYDKKTIATLTDGVRVFELADKESIDYSEFFDFMAVSVKAVSTSAPDAKVHVRHKIGDVSQGSTMKCPDLDKWLND